jgi:hypothetical protein
MPPTWIGHGCDSVALSVMWQAAVDEGIPMLWKVRWFFARTWRRVFCLGGDFREAESSPRASRLTELWESQWPGDEPVGHLLRHNHHDRHARFHSLPESKRYATSADETAEILRRDHAILADLLALSPSTAVHVIGQDWDAGNLVGGRIKRYLPGAWPWRIFADPDDYIPGEPTPSTYFWVLPIDTVEALDELLRRVADDEVRFIVTDVEMTWIFAPYDGGCDVFLPNGTIRDELEAKHPDWLPANSKRL